MNVTVIVPCYNEADRLELDRFEELLQRADVSLLFVDDGSSDATATLVDTWAAERPACRAAAASPECRQG